MKGNGTGIVCGGGKSLGKYRAAAVSSLPPSHCFHRPQIIDFIIFCGLVLLFLVINPIIIIMCQCLFFAVLIPPHYSPDPILPRPIIIITTTTTTTSLSLLRCTSLPIYRTYPVFSPFASRLVSPRLVSSHLPPLRSRSRYKGLSRYSHRC